MNVRSQTSVHLTLEQELANYGLRAKSRPSSNFINKVLLERSHTHAFIYCLWLLFHYRGRIVATEIR